MIRTNKSLWGWCDSQLADEEGGRKKLEDGFQRDRQKTAGPAETFELWELSL